MKKIKLAKLYVLQVLMELGKSSFSINLSKYIESKKIKTLLIDFDFFNNSLHAILGIKKYKKNNCIEINNSIIHI